MIHLPFDLFRAYGQYDNVVNISLKEGSPSFNKYGSSVTGELFYPKEDRKHFQTLLDANEEDGQPGKIKVRMLMSGIDEKLRYDLLYDGVDSEDINSVFSIPFSRTNDYVADGIRKMPDPQIIKINTQNFDEVAAMTYLYERLSELGNLPIFEQEQLAAYKVIANNYDIPDDVRSTEFFDHATNSLNSRVAFLVYEHKFLHATLTEEEDAKFKAIIESHTNASVEALFHELEIGNNSKKFSGAEYKQVIDHLTVLVALFKEERLTYTKVPVWWNLERYLHIYLRHVSEVQIGEHFKAKSTLQYMMKDVKDLVKTVLSQLSEQINLHFQQFPDRDFKRQGSMSHYYNGDYYAIHIRPDGLL